MCGICGKFNFHSENHINKNLIPLMCKQLIHRGPDDEGIFWDKEFGFGMRRLSIIDLEKGHQPIFNEDKSLGIIFNGEIYNYKELRQQLFSLGYNFYTNSDTETILRCYEAYGMEFLQKLNGMFAIAIFDTIARKLILARDRIGIKPLYYYLDEDKITFASEIKSILVDSSVQLEPNYKAIDLYLSFGYIPNPYSAFKGVNKLESGHYLIIDKHKILKKKYWDVIFSPDFSKNENEHKEEFLSLFKDSVKLRMRSDVPYGAFLSGGIDSSLIVASMSEESSVPIKTFSIGFNDSPYHDETKYAELIAKKFSTDHQSFHVDSDILGLLNMYVHHFDEPFADYAAFPTFAVSKLAREHVKVVLTGDGGDEIFAGYKRYYAELLANYLVMVPPFIRNKIIKNVLELTKKLLPPNRFYDHVDFAIRKLNMLRLEPDKRYIHSFIHNYFSYEEKIDLYSDKSLLDEDFSYNEFTNYWDKNLNYEFLGKRLFLDLKTKLPEDMMTKVDRMSMAVSLEARIPFLDHRIIEFSTRLPSKYKMNMFRMKRFLKKSSTDFLPSEIIKRHKHGFSSPIDKWFRWDMKEFLNDTFNSNSLKIDHLLDYNYVNNLLEMHLHGKANNGNKLFTILILQMWFNKYFGNLERC